MQRALVIVAGAIVAALVAASASAELSALPVKVFSTNDRAPAAAGPWFAWTRSTTAHPHQTTVFAQEPPGDAFSVNHDGTRGWTGGIDGNLLVYQEISSGESTIKLFDLTQPTGAGFTAPVNTPQWEWRPSISTDSLGETWILFGRRNTATGAKRIIAHNLDHPTASRVLQRTTNPRYRLIPGQVNADYATWTACRPRCNVRFVNLVAGTSIKTVPKPAWVADQYGSSINVAGLVYFIRSGSGCGRSVRIVRYGPGKTTTRLHSFTSGHDSAYTFAADQSDGVHVYYDRVACSNHRWDIYKVIDPP